MSSTLKARKFNDILDDEDHQLDSKRIKSDDTTSDEASEASFEDRQQKIANAFRTIIECLGEDADREGLERTPLRAAKALQFFASGYCQTISDVIGEGVFNEETQSDMVLVKNIDIHSLCEHHLVPFSGKVSLDNANKFYSDVCISGPYCLHS